MAGRGKPRGRRQNVPNMKRAGDMLVNQHGVKFTEKEKRALESAVNSANRKRRNMLKQEATLPRKVRGQLTGQEVSSLQLMGKESDFILAPKTKSLQRFQTKADYTRYMGYLKRVNSRDYLDIRAKQYKANYISAIKETYGTAAKDVIMKVQMMPTKDFMKAVQSDEMLEIGYVYPDNNAVQERLNDIRASWGMDEKPIEDTFTFEPVQWAKGGRKKKGSK